MPPVETVGWFARSPVSTLTGACHGDCTLVFRLTAVSQSDRAPWERRLYRSKAKIKTSLKRGYPEPSTSSLLYARELPQELVGVIIAHVILDTSTLKACSATCRSWYIATLPHLHHTLTLCGRKSDPAPEWFTLLQKLGETRLLPFVKRLQILQNHADHRVPPTIFNAQSLVYFSALTNVQELGIDELDFRGFTPQTRRFFGHFAPTLRSLALRSPRGSDRQLLEFLGLFPNLDDLKLRYGSVQAPTPDPALIPHSAPSLRGRLTLTWVDRVGFLRGLSNISGGLRFRHMDLLKVGGACFLLDTCADTLETLRIHPECWTAGERHSQMSQSSSV